MNAKDRSNEVVPSPPEVLEGETSVFRRLVGILTDSGVPFVHMHHEAVFTSAEAAAARGTTLRSGAKALIIKAGETFRMTVMPADLLLNSNALRRLLKSKRMRFATPEEVAALTGLVPGSIPPFGSLFGLKTICDERLQDNDRINFNAGSHTESLQMPFEAYLRFESPQVADIAKPRPAARG